MMESETHFLGKKVVKLQDYPLYRAPSQIYEDVEREVVPAINPIKRDWIHLSERLDFQRN
jgi:hypothetical protein